MTIRKEGEGINRTAKIVGTILGAAALAGGIAYVASGDKERHANDVVATESLPELDRNYKNTSPIMYPRVDSVVHEVATKLNFDENHERVLRALTLVDGDLYGEAGVGALNRCIKGNYPTSWVEKVMGLNQDWRQEGKGISPAVASNIASRVAAVWKQRDTPGRLSVEELKVKWDAEDDAIRRGYDRKRQEEYERQQMARERQRSTTNMPPRQKIRGR